MDAGVFIFPEEDRAARLDLRVSGNAAPPFRAVGVYVECLDTWPLARVPAECFPSEVTHTAVSMTAHSNPVSPLIIGVMLSASVV